MNILIDYNPPSFCIKFGRKFPWTLTKLRAARKLTNQLADLSEEEKETLKNTLDDIVRGTPNKSGCWHFWENNSKDRARRGSITQIDPN